MFALDYLHKHNINVLVKPYMDFGITRAEIYDILEITGCKIQDLVRQDEVLRDKYMAYISPSKESLIGAIVDHPILLQRPIVLFKEKAIGAICRSEDSLQALLQDKVLDMVDTQ